MTKLSIRDLELAGQRLLLRVDFNVPLDDKGRVTDDTRIRETLPTLEYAMSKGARPIIVAHLGRPKGPNPKLSLKPVASRLEEVLKARLRKICFVRFATDCVGAVAEGEAAKLGAGEVLLLENLRFHPEEEANDENFSRSLARLAELYVNDAFGTAHRAHASTVGVTRFVKKSGAGLLMEKELRYLGQVLADPQRPFVAILGGVKVSDKIGVIRNLLTKVDALLIGGAMAYTFLKSQGKRVGNSLVEDDKLELARELMTESQANNIKFLLPVDHVIAEKASDEAEMIATIEGNQAIPEGMMGLDIGPETVEMFADVIGNARTIVWNGPMGVFEVAPFSEGTTGIAHAIAANTQATSIVGGGDSVAAVHAAGVADKITHISTGGGASLEFLEGKKLPGIEALTDKT